MVQRSRSEELLLKKTNDGKRDCRRYSRTVGTTSFQNTVSTEKIPEIQDKWVPLGLRRQLERSCTETGSFTASNLLVERSKTSCVGFCVGNHENPQFVDEVLSQASSEGIENSRLGLTTVISVESSQDDVENRTEKEIEQAQVTIKHENEGFGDLILGMECQEDRSDLNLAAPEAPEAPDVPASAILDSTCTQPENDISERVNFSLAPDLDNENSNHVSVLTLAHEQLVHKPLKALINQTNMDCYCVDSSRIKHKAGLSKRHALAIPHLHARFQKD
ncbi:LAMI_0H07998g1_1 [Lachancea mirantina]|uniref:LAMI_0H07998g1_1 n=1 Tax=Lachancea mirantina TaxID=1230905 RepID=A0A1G4KFS1_9SACH|nr:LAMI_0H07998g1_1 [Lachancea mirantina]